MTVKSDENPAQEDRYVRINPDIEREPPALDAKETIEKLQNLVSHVLTGYESKLQLEQIVFCLVASTFYYEKEHVTRNRMERTATVTGEPAYIYSYSYIDLTRHTARLQCRFEESSKLLKELGRFFKKRQRAGEGDSGQPYFEIWSGVDNHIRQKASAITYF